MPRAPRAAQLPGGQPPEDTDTQAPADETLEQKVARLETENQALKEAQGKALPPEAPESLDEQSYREHARTLRAKDVDATRLRRAVLTQDGWVCPVTLHVPSVKQ